VISRLNTPFRHLRRLSILLLIALAMPLAASAAEEQSPTSLLANMSNTQDGKPFLSALLDKFQTMKAYQYEILLTIYNKAKPVLHSGHFVFKNPNLVRYEVTSSGRLKGSVVVRQPDGQVKARSAALFGMVIGLSPDSRVLKTSTGYNILQSDFASLIRSVLSTLDSSTKCKVTKTPTSFPGVDRAYVLEVMRDPGQVLHRIIVDGQSKLPVEWCLFGGTKLLSVLHVQKLSEMPQLEDLAFSLDSRGGESGTLGEKANIDEVLREELSSLAADINPGTAILNDARLALVEMNLQCEALEKEVLQPASRTESLQSTVPHGFLRAATIESLAYSLGRFEKALSKIDSPTNTKEKAGSATETKKQSSTPAPVLQWHKHLSAINASTAKLYDILQSNSPDTKPIAEEARKMQGHQQALALILSDFMTRI
jgi:outer membrane lipoprotein-sorting protein